MHKERNNSKIAYYAKIIIVFSVTLFVYFFVYNYLGNHKLVDPIKNVTPITDEESTISITTSDGSEVVPGNTITGAADGGTTKSIPDISNRNATTGTGLDDENNVLRNEIQNKFGVTVHYGHETDGYVINTSGGAISTTSILDSVVINNQLVILRKVLGVYPPNMFKEIKDGGIPLTILLINNYSEASITGITDSSYSYANISIAAIHPFEESFYHESYHYIERYLFKKGANYNSWESLNPVDFVYGNIYNDYSYSNTFAEDAPFVNNYAQTAAAEDRASTFEYMMADSKASCLNYGTPVWTKATYISRTIEAVLSSASSNTREYWERHLY